MYNESQETRHRYTHSRILQTAHGSACGKVILVGEHAAVYGARAIAIPLKQMRMQVELIPAIGKDDAPFSVKLGGKELSPRIRSVVLDAFQLLDCAPSPVQVVGSSNLPVGAGLGSSATLCVVILRTLAQSLGMDLTRDQLATFGNRLEERFHGQPSGLDTAVVAYEDAICFSKGQPVQSLSLPHRQKPLLHCALVDSGVRASTISMIHMAAPYFRGPDAESRINRFDTLSQVVMDGLYDGDVIQVAEAMNEAGVLLSEAGIVTDQLASMIAFCREIGCLAAKSTGAGGGGVILSLLDPEAIDAQLAALRQEFGNSHVYYVTL